MIRLCGYFLPEDTAYFSTCAARDSHSQRYQVFSYGTTPGDTTTSGNYQRSGPGKAHGVMLIRMAYLMVSYCLAEIIFGSQIPNADRIE